jgi:hypothetical protein
MVDGQPHVPVGRRDHVLGCESCRRRLSRFEGRAGVTPAHESARLESLRAVLADVPSRACAAVGRRLLGELELWAPEDDLHALECATCGALLERQYAAHDAGVHGLCDALDRLRAMLVTPPTCVAEPRFDVNAARALSAGEGDDDTLDRFAEHLPRRRSATR